MSDKSSNAAPSLGKFTVRGPAKTRQPVDAEATSTLLDVVEHDVKHDVATTGDATLDALPDDLIEVGAIAQAYGVRGQVKIFPHASVGEGGDALLTAPHWWICGGRPKLTRRIKVTQAREHSGSIAAALAGVIDRTAAEALRGSTVWVRRRDFPKLDKGEYYWVDLIGLDVVNPAGTALGRVSDLIDNGAHSVLRVAYEAEDATGKSSTQERLIPFVDAYLCEVDLPGKRIVVEWDIDY